MWLRVLNLESGTAMIQRNGSNQAAYWIELEKEKDAGSKLSEELSRAKSHSPLRIQGRKTQQCSGFKRICRNASLTFLGR